MNFLKESLILACNAAKKKKAEYSARKSGILQKKEADYSVRISRFFEKNRGSAQPWNYVERWRFVTIGGADVGAAPVEPLVEGDPDPEGPEHSEADGAAHRSRTQRVRRATGWRAR